MMVITHALFIYRKLHLTRKHFLKKLGRARNYLDSTRELFERRMLMQEIEHCSVEYVSSGGGYFALVKGILNLSGIYFGYPHIQKRDFALLMRLERSASDFELPFRVEGLKLYEEEHQDE